MVSASLPLVCGIEFERLLPKFPEIAGTRSIIKVHADRIADSCGFAVPRYEFQGDRDQLIKFAENMGPEKIRKGQLKHNKESIDGLPGIAAPSPVAWSRARWGDPGRDSDVDLRGTW